jgi:uncharacterized small protein (DUF1192 family)
MTDDDRDFAAAAEANDMVEQLTERIAALQAEIADLKRQLDDAITNARIARADARADADRWRQRALDAGWR